MPDWSTPSTHAMDARMAADVEGRPLGIGKFHFLATQNGFREVTTLLSTVSLRVSGGQARKSRIRSFAL